MSPLVLALAFLAYLALMATIAAILWVGSTPRK